VPDLDHLFRRFLGEREFGYFVEVGAFDGVIASNTWGLAERGWQGLMIEPVPDMASACRANHQNHPRVRVVECAVGSTTSDKVTLYLAGTLTSANADAIREYETVAWAVDSLTENTVTVESATLDSILAKYVVPVGFDLLVVDVEGYETEVFDGFSIANWRPRMLIVELADTHPDLAATMSKDAKLSRSITKSGYVIIYKDRINTVFVRNEDWARAFDLHSG